eukprot:7130041-Ditylum_brightwellii.AAC.1
MKENHCKRKNNKKDSRDNKSNKGYKKAKFGNGAKTNNKGLENVWTLFKNIPDREDCPKHGKVHNAGS